MQGEAQGEVPATAETDQEEPSATGNSPAPGASRDAPAASTDEQDQDERPSSGGRIASRDVESGSEEGGREDRSAGASGSRGSYEGERYTIAPPSGWTRRRSGQRTTWSGPGSAQILVEVASDTAASPRADWEKLDRGFRKKYGRRYRSLGIRDTTLAGLPAAVWEFELDSKSGRTTRKIDNAVHSRGRGYAVLGSAPAERFEEVRPQIEEAIASFRLRSSASSEDEQRGRSEGRKRDKKQKENEDEGEEEGF